MYGTASKSKHGAISAAGASPIDYKTENFSERVRALSPDGVDTVFDPVGGMNWWQSYRLVRPGGALVCYGIARAVTHGKIVGAGSFLLLGILRLIPDRRRSVWYNVTSWRKIYPDWFRADLRILFDLLAQRKIQPIIAARLPLREAAKANEWIERADVAGKIVLLCQE